jgi:hypothetical protein
MVRNVEACIQEGEWPHAFSVADFCVLFYPSDRDRAAGLERLVKAAIAAGELSLIGERLLPSNVCAWPDCPPVPADSPLRFWLPAWMHEQTAPLQSTADPQPGASGRRWTPEFLQQLDEEHKALIADGTKAPTKTLATTHRCSTSYLRLQLQLYRAGRAGLATGIGKLKRTKRY